MRTVWKFPLEIKDRQKLEVPKDARFRAMQTQGDGPIAQPCLWLECDDDPEVQTETLEVVTVGTGHPIPDEPLKYLGTYQVLSGDFVGHVYVVDNDPF